MVGSLTVKRKIVDFEDVGSSPILPPFLVKTEISMESKNYFYETDADDSFIEIFEDDWKSLAEKYSNIFGEKYSEILEDIPLIFDYGVAKDTGAIAVTVYDYYKGQDIIYVRFDLAFLKAIREMDLDDYASLMMHEMIHCRTALEDHKNPNEHKDRFWNYADKFNSRNGNVKWNITEFCDIEKINDYLTKNG